MFCSGEIACFCESILQKNSDGSVQGGYCFHIRQAFYFRIKITHALLTLTTDTMIFMIFLLCTPVVLSRPRTHLGSPGGSPPALCLVYSMALCICLIYNHI